MDMMNMLQQMQLAQQKIAEAQAELPNLAVTEVGGGVAVRVTITGALEIKSLSITPEAAEDREMLEDLLQTTINRAIASAQTMARDHLGRATQGLIPNIPGLGL